MNGILSLTLISLIAVISFNIQVLNADFSNKFKIISRKISDFFISKSNSFSSKCAISSKFNNSKCNIIKYKGQNITGTKRTDNVLIDDNFKGVLKDLDKLAGKCAVKIQVLESFLKGSLDDLKKVFNIYLFTLKLKISFEYKIHIKRCY